MRDAWHDYLIARGGTAPPTASQRMIKMATMTTTEIAADLDTTPRTLRKFLRSADSGFASVGKGSRYAIEKRDMRALRTRFAKWVAANEKATDAPADDAPADADAPATDA